MDEHNKGKFRGGVMESVYTWRTNISIWSQQNTIKHHRIYLINNSNWSKYINTEQILIQHIKAFNKLIKRLQSGGISVADRW